MHAASVVLNGCCLSSSLRRRFAQNQEDCNFTILALLPTLGDQLFSHMDVEGLTAKLQRGRQSPAGAESTTPANQSIAAPVNGNAAEGAAQEHIPSTHETMEQVWTKLGPAKETTHGPTNGTNGIHAELGSEEKTETEAVGTEAAEENGAAVHAEAEEEEGRMKKSDAAHDGTVLEHMAAEGAGTSSDVKSPVAFGLEAVSEPAPLPIPSDARLTPSPSSSATPSAEPRESEKADEEEAAPAVNGREQPPPAMNTETSGNESAQPNAAPAKMPSPEELLAEKKEKLALWNELKITAFSRTLTTLYSLVLLSLQTHIQLNLLGRYAYLTSVATLSAPASSHNHQIRLERHDGVELESEDEEAMAQEEDEVKGIDLQTERLYLTFSWWFLHQGWKELADEVQGAVEEVIGGMALKSQLTHQDFLSLLNKIRRRVEHEPRDEAASTTDLRSEWSEATTTQRRGKRRSFLSVLFPSTPEEEVSVLQRAGAISASSPPIKSLADLSNTLPALLDETKDLIESHDFARILRLSLNRVFEVFENTLRPTFGVEPPMTTAEVDGLLRQSTAALAPDVSRFQQLTDDGQAGVRVRLASLFPAVARQSSAAINGVPNEYVEALTEIKELKAFSAVIYSSWT